MVINRIKIFCKQNWFIIVKPNKTVRKPKIQNVKSRSIKNTSFESKSMFSELIYTQNQKQAIQIMRIEAATATDHTI